MERILLCAIVNCTARDTPDGFERQSFGRTTASCPPLTMARRFSAQAKERLGFLVHELRNSLHTASLAMTVLETGQLPIAGPTGAVLKRSLAALTLLVERALEEIREPTEPPADSQVSSLAAFFADAGNAAILQANALGCAFTVKNVETRIEIEGHRDPLLGALVNLLQNAFKFNRPHTEVSLRAYAGDDGAVSIDVEGHCGGLPPGAAETMFGPHVQRHEARSGLGLGLTIARANVQADGGTLSVRDVPGRGCVFTLRLPRHVGQRTKARGPARFCDEVLCRNGVSATSCSIRPQPKEISMNKDQVKGAVKDAAGKLQEQIGKATGSRKQQAKGLAKQASGKVQKAYGDVKQALKDAEQP